MNKADRDGADATVRDLELMIALGCESMIASGKQPRARRHTARARPAGDRRTAGALDAAHREVRRDARGGDRRARRLRWRSTAPGSTGPEAGARGAARASPKSCARRLREALIEAAMEKLGPAIDEAVHAVETKALDPYTATEQLVARFRSS